MKKMIAALAFSLASVAAWALPTTQEVEAAVQQDHYAQAETMMGEVVAAKPDSAKAHYVYAEMLAHNGNFTKATAEATRARQLDPAVKFTTPDKFQAFEQLLQREQASPTQTRAAPTAIRPAQVQAAPASSGIPSWVWIAGLVAVAFFLWRAFSRSRAMAPGAVAGPGSAMAAGGPFNAGPPGVPPGTPAYGPGMPQAAVGSGMLGTGLAVAGGVAGGMMLGEMLHNRQGAGSSPLDRLMPTGLDAPTTNEAANALENRPVDFGNGGDWDAGGSPDVGAGSDGGGGWD